MTSVLNHNNDTILFVLNCKWETTTRVDVLFDLFNKTNISELDDLCWVVLSIAIKNRFLVESMTTRATSFVTGPHLISHINSRISSHYKYNNECELGVN